MLSKRYQTKSDSFPSVFVAHVHFNSVTLCSVRSIGEAYRGSNARDFMSNVCDWDVRYLRWQYLLTNNPTEIPSHTGCGRPCRSSHTTNFSQHCTCCGGGKQYWWSYTSSREPTSSSCLYQKRPVRANEMVKCVLEGLQQTHTLKLCGGVPVEDKKYFSIKIKSFDF